VYDSRVIKQAEAVLSGGDPGNCDPSLCSKICCFLRDQRGTLSEADRPDYPLIQRIADVVSGLRLLSTQTSFCDAKYSEVDRLGRRLEQARGQLQSVLDGRARVELIFGEPRFALVIQK
jgi:hypothetical protein